MPAGLHPFFHPAVCRIIGCSTVKKQAFRTPRKGRKTRRCYEIGQDEGIEKAPHRALFSAVGLLPEELERPIIGIANSASADVKLLFINAVPRYFISLATTSEFDRYVANH